MSGILSGYDWVSSRQQPIHVCSNPVNKMPVFLTKWALERLSPVGGKERCASVVSHISEPAHEIFDIPLKDE